MTDLPETCDFCDLPPNEGESLVEVRFGQVPQPEIIRVDETDSMYRRENNRQAQCRLLCELLDDHELFDLQLYDMVEEVTAIGGEAHFYGPTDSSSENGEFPPVDAGYDFHYDNGKVGVRLSVYPDAIEEPADAHLCSNCVDLFSGD